MDNKNRIYNDNPVLKANFFSRLFFCWISPLMALGQKRPLEEEDLFKPLPDEETCILTNKLDEEWNKELLKKNPSLVKAMTRVWIRKTLLISIFVLISETVRVIQPIFFRYLMKYFNGQIDFQWALIYGTIICLNTIITGIIHHPYFDNIIRIGMQMRIATCGLVYRKALKLNASNSASNSSGKIINLLSNDCSRFEMALIFAPYLIVGPLQLIAILVLLFEMVDKTILCGILLLVLCIPFQSYLGKVLNTYRMKTSKIADERINLTSEIFNGIKIIKMYCWEEPLQKIIDALRRKELISQSRLFTISAINNSVDTNLSGLMIYTSIAVFINIVNKPLLPGYVVIIMAYYLRICTSIAIFAVKGFTFMIAGRVSCKRIQDLLLQPEIDHSIDEVKKDETKRIVVHDLSASWDQNSKAPVLQKISLEVKENELLAVVGAVGAGKSSLLMALLGEMPSIKGDVKLNGSIFYVSQEPWIFSSTIKQNILFGKEYSKDKFSRIIKACSLRDDLKMLPNGENTLIGDKGVNLSGGQRARVNLARALYHDPDIYLFDDPLSAVDASVAKELFDNCINGYLKSKVRILVTHQVHHLAKANEIIVLKNGEIEARGIYSSLLKNSSINFSSLLTSHTPKPESTTNPLPLLARQQSKESENEKHFDNEILEMASSQILSETCVMDAKNDSEYDETRATGALDSSLYRTLFSFGIASVLPVLVLMLYIVAQTASTSADYWLSYWATQEESFMIENQKRKELCSQHNDTSACANSSTTSDYKQHGGEVYHYRNHHFTIYSILVATNIFLVLLRSFGFFGSSLLAARTFHRNMFNSVIKAKVRFFDLNPIGRIMNRFSKEIGNIDDVLPLTLANFLDLGVIVIGSIVIAIVINYWILIPIVPLTFVFLYVRRYFVQVSREIKRIEGICRSPIYVHTSNTLSGITTIRACNAQQMLINEYNVHSDCHTQAYYAFISVNRWFAIRMDTIVSIYSLFVVYGCIFLKDFLGLTPGQVGILLVYLFQIINLFQWTVRQSAEVENMMTSVERIVEYSTIKGEDLKTGKKKADVDWPAKGKIEFENVSFAYDDNLAPVLKDLSMTIDAHEKIGIVGRTGAGKSTFFQALYRMAEPSGRILIDGVEIKDVGLHELRSKISIIPQEPTLFTGTIRYNLDPFGLSEDSTLWKTLEIVQLKEAVKEMKDGLDSLVQKGGSNLSVGQKQLFCLARAILKKSKILIIDEATANVDLSTDALVQKAIRECFKECTVITIAHRLQTIMDSDRILCLSSGQLINYDTPYELLQDKQSILYELVHKLGKREEERMLEIAEKHAVEKELNSNSNNNTDGTHINDETTEHSETDALLKK